MADGRVDELKETIFNTNGKLDVFEQINLKLAGGEAERKILANNIEFMEERVNTRMNQINEGIEIQTKIFQNLERHTEDVMSELSKLKETYKAQCD